MSTPSDMPLQRASAPGLDALLGTSIAVLDGGFVRVVDYMGNDEAIVQAARVSYGHGTKRTREDAALIRYLMRHRHTSPFEMCEIKLHVRVPMDCWRQWIRHRTANVNEYSTRYSVAIDQAQQTTAELWRLQDAGRKQGSVGYLSPEEGSRLSEREREVQEAARTVYRERLELGVAREQARKDLPLSTYTEAYWKIDLHNLLNFLRLRMAAPAQEEIRAYAVAIGHRIVAQWCPVTWAAFMDYDVNAVRLARLETQFIQELSRKGKEAAIQLLRDNGYLTKEGKPVRELLEFEDKLAQLGLPAFWRT